jgi:hypothetical protein
LHQDGFGKSSPETRRKDTSTSIKTIARIVRTEVGRGTSFDDIPRINTRLLPSIPSVRFYAEYPCAWDDIVKENNEGKPIIAWVWLPDSRDPSGERGCGHSVVITDLDLSLGEIYFNDPIRGGLEGRYGNVYF